MFKTELLDYLQNTSIEPDHITTFESFDDLETNSKRRFSEVSMSMENDIEENEIEL